MLCSSLFFQTKAGFAFFFFLRCPLVNVHLQGVHIHKNVHHCNRTSKESKISVCAACAVRLVAQAHNGVDLFSELVVFSYPVLSVSEIIVYIRYTRRSKPRRDFPFPGSFLLVKFSIFVCMGDHDCVFFLPVCASLRTVSVDARGRVYFYNKLEIINVSEWLGRDLNPT